MSEPTTAERVHVLVNRSIHDLEDERLYLQQSGVRDLASVAVTLEEVERRLSRARDLIRDALAVPVLAGVTVISAEGTTTGDLMSDDSIRLGAVELLQQAEARGRERDAQPKRCRKRGCTLSDAQHRREYDHIHSTLGRQAAEAYELEHEETFDGD